MFSTVWALIKKILNKKGAVSSDVAKGMAKGIRQKYNTNIGLSTTGIAGPEGGSIDKPAGLVYIGLSTQDGEESFKFNFSISRKKNKLMFSQGALNVLRKYLIIRNVKICSSFAMLLFQESSLTSSV